MQLCELSEFYHKNFSGNKKQSDRIPLFRKKSNTNSYILTPQGRVLISYLIENLNKYTEISNSVNIDISLTEKKISPFLECCEDMKNQTPITYNSIETWLDFFSIAYKSDDEKQLSIEHALNLAKNPETRDLSAYGYEILAILYSFHYSNIELELLEPLHFKINPWLFAVFNTISIDNANLTYSGIKTMTRDLINDHIQKHLSSLQKLALSLRFNKTDFMDVIILQVTINIYQHFAKTVYTSSLGESTTERLRVYFNKYHDEKYEIGNKSRTLLSKYYSLHKKLTYYNKDLIFEYLNDFSLPAFDFLMNNKKYITRPSGRLFRNNMHKILSENELSNKGHLKYWMEYYFAAYSTYVLKEKKNISILQEADNISPITRIYLSILINNYDKVKKWFGDNEWENVIKNLAYTIATIEVICSTCLENLLSVFSTPEEICDTILEHDDKLNISGQLESQLQGFFYNMDLNCASGDTSYFIRLNAYNIKCERDSCNTPKKIIGELLQQKEAEKNQS